MDEATTPLLIETPQEMSIPDLLLDWVATEPTRPILKTTTDGEIWTNVSAKEMHDRVTSIAKGLIASGIEAGDKVGLMSRTRAEWTILDFAIWYAGAVTVPVYETSSAGQTAWILSNSGAKAVFVETDEHKAVVETARADIPDLQQIWSIDKGDLDALGQTGADVSDDQVKARYDALRVTDLATIIYTSGTTGDPKGAELTHGNFVELARNGLAALSEVVNPDSQTLLFMPLAHVFARFVEILHVAAGVPAGHTADPTATLMRDIGGLKPTFILSVPRVFEKVYNSSEQKAAAAGRQKFFSFAAKAAQDYAQAQETGNIGLGTKARYFAARKLVLHKITDALGGQAQYAISGGAPLGKRLNYFFRGVGLTVLEGYGLTETTAPVSVNLPSKSKAGTVGPPLPGVSIKIAEDGEILAKGIAVFRGYHNNPEADAQAFTDGWFHTGDIGNLDADGYLTITGRKKEIIVTAGGKNVAPSQLEDSLRAHPLISQVVVVGDQKPFIAALITLDPEMLQTWLSNHELPEMTVAEAGKNAKVLAELQTAIDATNTKVSRAESIRRFEVLDTDFTIDNDYLTPSMKVKRSKVLEDFSELIEDLYAKARAERDAG